MIDFRYHIVSIVSIFLALAVGILLGAGPLQEDLGKTLSSQVSTLRQEKTDLRTQLGRAQQRLDADKEFATDVTPALVTSRLGGRSIVIVTLPGADPDTVNALAQVLTTSGASVSGVVAVRQAWTDPAKSSFRDQLATSLAPATATASGAPSVPTTAPTTAVPGGSLDARMGALLAQSLVVSKLALAGRTTTAAVQMLAALKAANLVGFDADGPKFATLAVVVAPAPDATRTVDLRASDLSGWTAITRALDAASSGATVVGPPESAAGGGLVAAIRADPGTAKLVSTVDDADTAVGRIATVFALREQMTGSAGQYGVAAGASAVLPSLTAGGS